MSKKIADGNFAVRSYANTNDPQVMELMETFNFMASRVQILFKELAQEKEQLNSIISVMKDGLFVLDEMNRIVFANPSFEKIFQKKAIPGTLYWESVREQALFSLVEEVRAHPSAGPIREVEMRGQVFYCTVVSLEQKKQTLFIFHDITESKRLEDIKKDFIANVSHELRTPLTAIRGFVETMESDEKNGEKLHYLEVIRRHTDRLVNIVEDLLVLSQLEEKKQTLALSRIKVGDVLDNLALLFQPRIKAKGVAFSLTIDPDVPDIEADPFRLEQVFQNLLDNALKYTDEGSIAITVSAERGLVLVKVADTGIGIPAEALPRIFERFYVVDKSRSRLTGGTGLGLSIVKHIVLLHKGRIDVGQNSPKGTVFSVFLPIA